MSKILKFGKLIEYYIGNVKIYSIYLYSVMVDTDISQ